MDILGSVSPSGQYLSFVTSANHRENIAIWDVHTGTTRTLTAFDNLRDAEDGVAWSPDGYRLAISCLWDDKHRDIRSVDVTTGADAVVVTLDRAIDWVALLAWSPDGRFLAVGLGRGAGEGTIGAAQLALIAIADGTITSLKTLDGNLPRTAAFSSDGTFLAYDFAPRKDTPARDVFVISLDGTHDTAIAADPAAHQALLGWTANDSLIYASTRSGVTDVLSVPVRSGRRVATPMTIAHDVDTLTPLGTTHDGRLFVDESSSVRDTFVVNLDQASGKASGPLVPLSNGQPRMNRKEATWSPDGARIAFVEFREGQAESVVVQTIADGARRVYPVPVRNLDHPIWTPDGRAFLFDGTGSDDQQRMFQLDLETGRTTAVTDCVCFVHAISPDGRFWYQGGSNGLERRDTRSGSSMVVAPPEEADGSIGSSKLSPDGRWFAFLTHRPQPGALAIRAAEGGPRRALTDSFNYGYNRLAWTPDSQYVIFQRVPGGLFRQAIAGGPPEALGIRPGGNLRQLSLNVDGRRLALDITRSQDAIRSWQIERSR